MKYEAKSSVRPGLASTRRVNQFVNGVLYSIIIISKALTEKIFPDIIKYMIISNVSTFTVFCQVSENKNKTGQKNFIQYRLSLKQEQFHL